MELIWFAVATAAAGILFAVMAVRLRQGRAEHLRRPGAEAPVRDPDQEPIEEPPRPISEMTDKELAEWARGDPEKLKDFSLREGLALVGVVMVLWLVFWGVIVLWRRGSR